MHTLEAIKNRKSTRAYKPDAISEEAIETIIKAGCASPVAMARYDSLHITVIQNEDVINNVCDITSNMFFEKMGVRKNVNFGAKTMVLVSTNPEALPYEMACVNVGIVVENMVLAATDMGIDSVILGGVPRAIAPNKELVKSLGIPDGFTPILGAFLGYAENEEESKTHTISVNRI